jgi:hypothetical protein
MTPRLQLLIGAGFVAAWIGLHYLVEFIAQRPAAVALTVTTVALAGIARGVFELSRPR